LSALNPDRKNRPLRETIYADLRRQILSGRLLPGSRLVESSLSESLQVSRTVIREVIKQLELEGLVRITPYKGTEVSRFSLQDIEELYVIQAALEGLAGSLAAQRMKKEDLGELRSVHERLKKSVRKDPGEWQRLNIAFHQFFIDKCGNRRLYGLIKNHRDQFARYWRIILSIPGQREKSNQDHEKILRALDRGEPLKVRLAMEKHIGQSARNLTIFLEKHEFLI
jgi:DNA-binding GntR family transcriptional regulator